MQKNNNCSIKGCNYKAKFILDTEEREFRLCPKHKVLVVTSILKWRIIEHDRTI